VLARCVALACAWACALVVLLALTACAFAHASLVKAEPPDGAVVREAPAALTLTFNEPVSPLVVRLLGPDGEPIALGAIAARNATISIAAPSLRRGTHVLSWRVISADGHPVGGSVVFSIGAPSGQAPTDAQKLTNFSVAISLWTVRVLVYAGLFVGIGGAFFRAWIGDVSWAVGPVRQGLPSALLAALLLGLLAACLSVGLQGIDALDLPLSALARKPAWETGLETSYGLTALTAGCALLAGLFSFAAKSLRVARALSLVGLLGAGLALSLSGHASTAKPQFVSRPALFLHVACIGFWIGSLLPLYKRLQSGKWAAPELELFSRAIPLPVAIVAASGLWLAFVQLDHPAALWTTRYGQVLLCKLAAVAALLSLAAVNRYGLVPKFESGDVAATRPLATSIAVEFALALAILALVAAWRFTPPPRALAITPPISFHLHGEKAMAEIGIERASKDAGRANVMVLDGEFQPLAVKEVTLVLANPAAAIESMRRQAARTGDNTWRVEDVRVPVAGRWNLRIEILISDFEKVVLEEIVTLPQLP
jgi:copper transport protein